MWFFIIVGLFFIAYLGLIEQGEHEPSLFAYIIMIIGCILLLLTMAWVFYELVIVG